jgi:hypothetical protein
MTIEQPEARGSVRKPGGRGQKRPAHRGSVYVITIVTLSVAMILGIALMRAAGNSGQSAERFKVKMQLRGIADAGAEYGYWYYATRRPLLPATVENTLNGGKFTVTIDNFAAVSGTIVVTSKAEVGTQKFETTYLLPRPTALPGTYRVFDYAICSDQSMITTRSIVTGTGVENDNHVNVNGHLMWTSSSSRIYGNAYAAWNISSPYPQVSGTKITSAPMLPFPGVDWSYYSTNCAWYYSNDTEFKYGITFPYDGAIIYVSHDLKFQGSIRGRGTIVVGHDLQFTDSTLYATSSSKVAFIAGHQIKLPSSSGKSIVGLMYAHSSDFSAEIKVNGSTTVSWGALVGDTFNVGDSLTVVHDDDITEDPSIGATLHLPGY